MRGLIQQLPANLRGLLQCLNFAIQAHDEIHVRQGSPFARDVLRPFAEVIPVARLEQSIAHCQALLVTLRQLRAESPRRS